jgi:hypothetical protein
MKRIIISSVFLFVSLFTLFSDDLMDITISPDVVGMYGLNPGKPEELIKRGRVEIVYNAAENEFKQWIGIYKWAGYTIRYINDNDYTIAVCTVYDGVSHYIYYEKRWFNTPELAPVPDNKRA